MSDHVLANPGDPDVVRMQADLSAYAALEQKRAANRRADRFLPEQRPGGVLGLRTLLPEALGGIASSHQDPSIDEFKKATGATIVDPAAYEDWKDEQWAKAYDTAVAKGIPISRKPANRAEYEAAGDKAAADRIIRPVFGSVLAVGRGAAPGLVDAAKGLMSREDAAFMDSSEAAVPDLVKAPLEVLGAAKSKLLGGLARGVAEGLGAPRSAIGALGKGMGTGAVVSGAAGAMGDAGKLFESAMADHGPEVPPLLDRIRDTGTDSLLKTPGRAVVGGLFGLVPGAANAFRGSLRMPVDAAQATEAQRALTAAEDAGATTSLTSPGGIKPPPSLSALMAGKGPYEHPTAVAMDAAEPGLAKAVAGRISSTTSPLNAADEAYYAAADKRGAKASMGPMTRTVVSLIKGRSFSEGEGANLPLVDNKPLVKVLHETARPVLVTNHEAAALEAQGGVRVNLDEAIEAGMIPADRPIEMVASTPSRGELRNGPTTPPGADDAAAAAYEARIRELGDIRAPGGLPSKGEFRAGLENIASMNTPPGGTPSAVMGGRRMAAPGSLDRSNHSVVFMPRELSARQADEVIGAADRAAGISEAQGAGKADPAYAKFVRASREVRDQLPAIPGVTDKYPDVTIQGPDGRPMTLTGRSAMAHAHAEQLRAMAGPLKRAGLPTEGFDPTDVLSHAKVRPALRRVGIGEDNTTQALKSLVGKEGEQSINDVLVARLKNGGELTPKAGNVPSANEARAAAQLAHKYKYRLDPVAAFLGKSAPLSGLAPVVSDPVTQALLDLATRVKSQQGTP